MAVQLSQFLQALMRGYLIVIFSLVFLVIPVAGMVIVLVIAPFLGGREGAKQLNAQWADFYGTVAGLLWALILPLVLVVLLDTLSTKGIQVTVLEGWLLILVAALQLFLFWWGAHSNYYQRESRRSQKLRLRNRDLEEDLDDEELQELRKRHSRIVDWSSGLGLGRSKPKVSKDGGPVAPGPGTEVQPSEASPGDLSVEDQAPDPSGEDGEAVGEDGDTVPSEPLPQPPSDSPAGVPEPPRRLTREEIFGGSVSSPGQPQPYPPGPVPPIAQPYPPGALPPPGMPGPIPPMPNAQEPPQQTPEGRGRLFRPKGAGGKGKPAKPAKPPKRSRRRGDRRPKAAHLERDGAGEGLYDEAPPASFDENATDENLAVFGPPSPSGTQAGMPVPPPLPQQSPLPPGAPSPIGDSQPTQAPPPLPQRPAPPPLTPRETPMSSGSPPPREDLPPRRKPSGLSFGEERSQRADYDGLDLVAPSRSPTSGPEHDRQHSASEMSEGSSPGISNVVGAIAKGAVTGFTKATTDIVSGTLEAATAQSEEIIAEQDAKQAARKEAKAKEDQAAVTKKTTKTSSENEDPIAAAVAAVTEETEK